MAYTTIDDPSAYFQTTLYTGDGGGTRAVTHGGNSDLNADWVWIKDRGTTSTHYIFDSVRDVQKHLTSAASTQELSDANSLKAFNSNSFTLGTSGNVNGNSRTFVSWNWKAGTSFTNSAGANGADVASAGSVNTDAGFSIVTYSGTSASSKTIFHGLTAVPKMMLIKCLNNAENWSVYHKSMTALNGMYLNLTSAQAAVDLFADTEPTSSVFSVNQDSRSGENGKTYVAYCFAEKKGYSKFGSFVGNGNNDGTFVYTGFKPALLIAKSTTSTNDWVIFDNKRDPFNLTQHKLYPSGNDAEATSENDFDFLSNGFKLRQSGYGTNTFIYMAIASNPFVTSTGVPTTAR